MTEYLWEFGIDWNATEPTGVSYLRGGLAKKVNGEFTPSPGTEPVEVGDEVTFRVFDITSLAPDSPSEKWVEAIPYFRIFSQAAVKAQLIDNGLSNLQPTFTPDGTPLASICFPTEQVRASWTSTTPVSVDHVGRFLLTVNVQATGTQATVPDGRTRFFRHDPEMVVGSNG